MPQEPAGKPVEPVAPKTETPPVQKEETPVYAGKYKTPQELEAAYTGLESKLGEQGNELGSLKKSNAILISQLEKAETPKENLQTQDLNAELEAIQEQVEEGTLGIGEGIAKTAKITGMMASEAAVKTIQEQQAQNTIEGAKAAFSKEHEDFFELQQSGALEEVKARYPGLHDDFSAYWQIQADQQARLIEAARNEGIEAGKEEMKKVASGDHRTDRILQTPGTEAKEIGRKEGPYTQNELRNSGLEALRKAREG